MVFIVSYLVSYLLISVGYYAAPISSSLTVYFSHRHYICYIANDSFISYPKLNFDEKFVGNISCNEAPYIKLVKAMLKDNKITASVKEILLSIDTLYDDLDSILQNPVEIFAPNQSMSSHQDSKRWTKIYVYPINNAVPDKHISADVSSKSYPFSQVIPGNLK